MTYPTLLTVKQLTELTSEMSREGTYGKEHPTRTGQRYQEYRLSEHAVDMIGSHGADYIIASLKAALPKVTGDWHIRIGINQHNQPAMIVTNAPCDVRQALARESFSAEMRQRINSGNVVPVVVFPAPTLPKPPATIDIGDALSAAMADAGLLETPTNTVAAPESDITLVTNDVTTDAPGRG